MDYILKEARRLKKMSDMGDPFEICASVGINVVFADIGSLKGFYKYIKRNRYVVINENLDERTARLVCAHELGHVRLHREFAKHSFLREYMMYDRDSRAEYEANLFAAELLLDDEEVMELLCDGYTYPQAAHMLDIDTNLLLIKVDSMNKRGMKFKNVVRQSDFL